MLIFNKLKSVLFNIKAFAQKHPLFVLFFLLLFTSVFVFFQFLFENQVYIYSGNGSDTNNVYYPFFASLQRKIEAGDLSLWDFTHGLGTNALTRQADVGSIFTYLTILFGAENIKFALPVVQILKIFISGFACYFYLNNFKFSAFAKITASYIFAFNGFIMLWGQHYFFAVAPLYTVLLLLALERALKSKKGYLLVAFITCIIALTSYYFAYMILIVGGIYALFRLVYLYSFKETKKGLIKLGALLGAVILGLGMGAVLFLPSVSLVTSTSARLDSSMSLFEKIKLYLDPLFFDKATLKMIVTRLFSNNLTGSEGYIGALNYYEAPQWFFTSFILFFSFIFIGDTLLDKEQSLKGKILKLLTVLMIFVLAFQPLFSVVLNGFSAPFFRYTYLVMPLFALMFAFVLDRLIYKKLRFPVLQILLSASLSLVILAVVFIHLDPLAETGRKIAVIYALMTFCLTVFILLLQKKRLNNVLRILSVICVLGVICLNVSLEGYVTTNKRQVISKDNAKIYESNGNNDVFAALEYINESDDTFFRTEKTFDDIAFLNDSMLQGYYGVSVYNSVVNKNIIYFVNYVCPEFNGEYPTGYYDFRNIYDREALASLLGVKYILANKPIDNVPEYKYIDTFGNVLLYENTASGGIGSFYNKTICFEDFFVLSQEEKIEALKDTLILDTEAAFIDSSLENSTVEFEKPVKSNLLQGTANIKEEGFIFMPIPYEDGWKAYVDGVETQMVKADIAFCAIPVTQGQHSITLKYQTPYIAEGAVISLISFAIYISACIVITIFIKKESRSKNDSL